MSRAITVVVLNQTIFLLGIFGEKFTTIQGGPGSAWTTLPQMTYPNAVIARDIGRAAVGGIIAVILATIIAYFFMRSMEKNLDARKMKTALARAVTPRRKLLFPVAAWSVALLIFFPILWTILTSLITEVNAVASPLEMFTAHRTLDDYVEVWGRCG